MLANKGAAKRKLALSKLGRLLVEMNAYPLQMGDGHG